MNKKDPNKLKNKQTFVLNIRLAIVLFNENQTNIIASQPGII